MFSFLKRKKAPYEQSSTQVWQDQWRSLVPPECRNVPVEVDGVSVEAYVLVNHFAMMLQDGLLMEASFFDVCEHFQRAGYHVIWLMRCTQDVYNGYLKRGGERNGSTRWFWRKPTTNLGRVTWATSDDDTKMVPGRTEFQTVPLPATPKQLLRWLNGESLRSISERN